MSSEAFISHVIVKDTYFLLDEKFLEIFIFSVKYEISSSILSTLFLIINFTNKAISCKHQGFKILIVFPFSDQEMQTNSKSPSNLMINWYQPFLYLQFFKCKLILYCEIFMNLISDERSLSAFVTQNVNKKTKRNLDVIRGGAASLLLQLWSVWRSLLFWAVTATDTYQVNCMSASFTDKLTLLKMMVAFVVYLISIITIGVSGGDSGGFHLVTKLQWWKKDEIVENTLYTSNGVSYVTKDFLDLIFNRFADEATRKITENVTEIGGNSLLIYCLMATLVLGAVVIVAAIISTQRFRKMENDNKQKHEAQLAEIYDILRFNKMIGNKGRMSMEENNNHLALTNLAHQQSSASPTHTGVNLEGLNTFSRS